MSKWLASSVQGFVVRGGWLIVAGGLVLTGCETDTTPPSPGGTDAVQDGGGTEDVDAVGDSQKAPDEGPSLVCEPASLFCASDLQIGRCADDGMSWGAETFCGADEICDATSGQPVCAAVVCEPGSLSCQDGTTFLTCNTTGTGYLPDAGSCEAEHTCSGTDGCLPWECVPDSLLCVAGAALAQCDADGLGSEESLEACGGDTCHHCVTGGAVTCESGQPGPAEVTACGDNASCIVGEGCVDWVCAPSAPGCLANGDAAWCSEDGQQWLPWGGSATCVGPGCVQCFSLSEYIVCDAGAAPAEATIQTCAAGSSCQPLDGCVNWICTPGESYCNGNTYNECKPDGSGFESTVCNGYSECVGDGQNKGCWAGDPVGSDLIMECTPLPPMGDGSWTVPPDWATLDVVFSVGIVPDGSKGFVNLAPLTNKQTGGYIADLLNTDGTSPDSGQIRLLEDGVEKPLSCVPLVASEYAMTDLVFILDVTGSMGSTIDKVKQSTVDLANFLVNEGMDVRFGVVPYDDYVPAKDGGASIGGGPPQVFPLNEDGAILESWVDQIITATGGGDGPENTLDAVAWAVFGPPTIDGFPAGPAMVWRKGAQKTLVVMTDNLMHHKADGTDYCDSTLVEVLAGLAGGYTVHTLSTGSNTDPFPDGSHVDARVLSCGTGGTAADLNTFNQAAIQEALFAKALSQSYNCFFDISAPIGEHTIEVVVDYTYLGQPMSGSTTQIVSYEPDSE